MSEKTVTLSNAYWKRIAETTTTWLLDYADPNDGDWPERQEYINALTALHEALGTVHA